MDEIKDLPKAGIRIICRIEVIGFIEMRVGHEIIIGIDAK